MTVLTIHPAQPRGSATADPTPIRDGDRIGEELRARGLRFERWPARLELSDTTGAEEILAAYGEEIARVRSEGGYSTVDAIRMTPDHPDREPLRGKFLAEHTHAEDEVRFFVEGRGLFCLHIGEEVLQLLCERNDWITVPAGTPHWFDMGPRPRFSAIRFFNNPEGWVASFTGDPIAERFPLLED